MLQLYNIPLDEDGACEMFQKLAVKTAIDEGRDIAHTGRWNGVRNDDGSATGNYQQEVVCGHHFFSDFLGRYPSVKKYRTASMSIMRAKKATPEVGECLLVIYLPVTNSFVAASADSQSSL